MKTGYFLSSGLMALLAVFAGCAPEKAIVIEPAEPVLEPARPVAEVPVRRPVESRPVESRPVAADPLPMQATVAGVPVITFEESVCDFGQVWPSTSHTTEFKFTNTGNGVLTFDRKPYAPCGCTIPELAKTDYAPGESGVLKVRYNAPGGAATDVKPIYVYSNDPKTPQYELTIKATVTVNVAISPDDVSLLLNQDNGAMPELTVTSTDGRAFAITHVTATNDVMTVPFDRTKKAAEIKLTPRVDMDKLTANPTGVLQIRTDHPQSGTLMVRYNAKPLFDVSHPRIILQNILPGEEITRDVWIRSNYDTKVEIASFTSANGMMSIKSQQEDGNHRQIVVKILPPTDAPAASRRYITDELIVHLTSGHDVSIRCSGWFRLN